MFPVSGPLFQLSIELDIDQRLPITGGQASMIFVGQQKVIEKSKSTRTTLIENSDVSVHDVCSQTGVVANFCLSLSVFVHSTDATFGSSVNISLSLRSIMNKASGCGSNCATSGGC